MQILSIHRIGYVQVASIEPCNETIAVTDDFGNLVMHDLDGYFQVLHFIFPQ